MKRIILAALAMFLVASFASASTLRWIPSGNTENYTIKGTIIKYRIVGQTDWLEFSTTESSVDIETTLNMIPGEDYEFAVSPYTTTGQEGPISEIIQYQHIKVVTPVIMQIQGVRITVEGIE